jgi:hypothetical protein
MMVKMVTAKIGKGGNMDIKPIKTMLFKAVAACLKRKVRYTGFGQGRQCCVKVDAIWRGQRWQA